MTLGKMITKQINKLDRLSELRDEGDVFEMFVKTELRRAKYRDTRVKNLIK